MGEAATGRGHRAPSLEIIAVLAGNKTESFGSAAFIRRMAVWLALLASMCVSVHAGKPTARLNELLDAWRLKNAPGMAAVLIRDGRIEYRKTFGFADLDARTPITSDTQFLLASLTKQFTAMAILILVERQKLRLDDSLAKYLPGVSGLRTDHHNSPLAQSHGRALRSTRSFWLARSMRRPISGRRRVRRPRTNSPRRKRCKHSAASKAPVPSRRKV